MRKGRKYILNFSESMSCGLGTLTGATVQCNILNSFSVTQDTIPPITCVYPTISTATLQTMSKVDYSKRIVDYLDYIKIDSSIRREKLISESSFDEPECDVNFCLLNPNFLVYKFLSGIRVVNYGSANGIAEFKIYPSGDDESLYDWQISQTFFNLDPNGIYIVEIRDILNGVEVCRYSKIISMPLLNSNTTSTLQTKTIKLNNISDGALNTLKYNTGCISVISPLSLGQKVSVNYVANAIASDSGTSYVQLTCKPYGTSSFVNYCCFNNIGTSPKCGTINLNYGDTICYSLNANGVVYGSCACADICLTSVDGLGTIIPSLDNFNSYASVCSSIPKLNIVASITGKTINDKITCNSRLIKNVGNIVLSNPIPNGGCVTIGLSGNSKIVGNGMFSSYAQLIFYCCSPINNVYDYINICSFHSSDPQPQSMLINMCENDSVCYNLLLNVGDYGSACSAFKISSISSTSQITPSISLTGNSISCNITVPPPLSIISTCRTYFQPNTCLKGVINIVPPLTSPTQTVNVNYEFLSCGCTTLKFYGIDTFNNQTTLGSSYGTGALCFTTGTFMMKNQYACYCYTMNTNCFGCFKLTSASGSYNINPLICCTKNGDSF